jgi:hypothetical protein
MKPRLQTLAEVEAAAWRELAAAVSDKRHAWRSPVLATTDGECADARTVILRGASPDDRRLVVYTDQRSAKVEQLRTHPRGTLVMWSPTLGWQLRCQVQLSMKDSGLDTLSRWAGIKLSPAAQDYLSPLPPGTALDQAEAAPMAPDREGLAFFAVIDAQVLAMDWLELHRGGHRRAVFDAEGARWVQP